MATKAHLLALISFVLVGAVIGSEENSCTKLGGVCQKSGEECEDKINFMSWACGWNVMKWQCCKKTKPDIFEDGSDKNSCTKLGGVCQKSGEECEDKINFMSWACGWNVMKWQCCKKTKPDIFEDDTDCGESHVSVSDDSWRIMNGNNAQRGAWPWQVSLQQFGRHFCGATIVDKHWIISAAHCFYQSMGYASYRIPTRYVQVVVGEHDTSVDDQWERVHYVERIFVPNGYLPSLNSSPHDLALVRLTKPIQFNRNVKKACLPKHWDHDHFEGRDCWITGWGDTAGTADRRYLQQLQTPVIEQEQCKVVWGWDNILEGMICVGHPYHGACQGDSGGPMQCKENGKWHLVGATSWGGDKCGHMPSVYTRVSKYLDWMKQVRQYYDRERPGPELY